VADAQRLPPVPRQELQEPVAPGATRVNSVNAMLSRLENGYVPTLGETIALLQAAGSDEELIYERSVSLTKKYHGDVIYLRGLIEFSNYCTNNCHYCGIRGGNRGVNRYRMSEAEIIESAQTIMAAHCGTIVLQSGIDPYYNAAHLAEVVREIKIQTGLAITLSIGTKTHTEMALLKDAGADRCLLRFETCNKEIFNTIHPDESLEARIECIESLKKLNYQTGSGFMIGLPCSTIEVIARDLLYTTELKLDMIGCGPFIPSPDSPLANETSISDHSICYKTIALLRIMNPKAHIPAATAFDALEGGGRDKVIACGANVFMPNFTPARYRDDYNLYAHKPQVDVSCDIYETVRKRIGNLNRKVSAEAGHALRTEG